MIEMKPAPALSIMRKPEAVVQVIAPSCPVCDDRAQWIFPCPECKDEL